MVRKLIEWALDNPLVVVLLAVALAVVGVVLVPQRQRRGLSRPGPGHHRGLRPVSRRVRRRNRTAGHRPAGSDLRRHARPQGHPQQVALRLERPQDELELRQPLHVRGGPAGSHQPAGDDVAAAAGRRDAADFARVSDRRDLPLRAQYARRMRPVARSTRSTT